MDGKTAHAAQCSKSYALTEVVDLILDIYFFEHQCVIIKGLLQSELLEQHIVTVLLNQSLSNSSMYEHKCLENIKKLHKSNGTCDYQLQYKASLEA